jgi:ribosomal protein S17
VRETLQLAGRTPKRERQLEAENEKLKAKVGDLVMQMDYLKNCKTGFSARETPLHP